MYISVCLVSVCARVRVYINQKPFLRPIYCVKPLASVFALKRTACRTISMKHDNKDNFFFIIVLLVPYSTAHEHTPYNFSRKGNIFYMKQCSTKTIHLIAYNDILHAIVSHKTAFCVQIRSQHIFHVFEIVYIMYTTSCSARAAVGSVAADETESQTFIRTQPPMSIMARQLSYLLFSPHVSLFDIFFFFTILSTVAHCIAYQPTTIQRTPSKMSR